MGADHQRKLHATLFLTPSHHPRQVGRADGGVTMNW